jgi:hypothetical protein
MQHLLRKLILTLHFNRIFLIKAFMQGRVAPRVQKNAAEDFAPEDLHSLIIEKAMAHAWKSNEITT